MMYEFIVQRSVATAVEPSPRVLEIAAMFGLGVDAQRILEVVPATRIPIEHGSVIFITGASGSGKSTILRCIAEQADAQTARTDAEGDPMPRVVSFDALPALPDRPLVDAFDLPLEEVTRVLALAGLADAFVMLRRPSELSDGQRYRLRLAQCMAMADTHASQACDQRVLVLADEFGATLDRLTAQLIARNVRAWTQRTGNIFIAATTHDDLLEALQPDVLVVKGLGETIEVVTRASSSK